MCKYQILVPDDLSYATLRVQNVSVKYYRYETDIIKELFERFKFDSPTLIEFGSTNYITSEFRELVRSYGYYIDIKGNVKPNEVLDEVSQVCYNTLEKEASEMLDLFEIKLKDEYRYHELCEILLAEGYTISAKEAEGSFTVSIH